MAYLADRSVNLLNVHYGLRYAGIAGGAAFFVPHMLGAGFTLPQVLLAIAAILAGRFMIRPLIVPVARWMGLRALVIFGTLLCALQFPLIAGMTGIGSRFALYIAVSSIGDMVYWTAFHAYFARLGDDTSRGRQIGARESVVAAVGIISPLVTGYVLSTAGPIVGFALGGIVTALAVIPLCFVPDVTIAPVVQSRSIAPRDSLLLFVADGWIGTTTSIVWSTILFVSLGGSYAAYGGAMALAAFGGAVGALALGSAIDRNMGPRIVVVALLALGVATAFKVIAIGSSGLAMAANALGTVAVCVYAPVLMTPVYNAAKASPCALRFHVATEGAWDVGAVAALILSAALLAYGAPASSGLLLAFVGFAVSAGPMLRYYAARQTTPVTAGVS